VTRTVAASFAAEPSWRGRGLAILRFIGFAVVFVVANLAIHPLLGPLHRRITVTEGHMLLEMVALGGIVLALTAVFARMGGRTIGAYGYRGPHAARNFAVGLASGFVLLAAQLLLMKALGCYSFGAAAPFSATLVFNAVFLAVLFLTVGFTEEALFRGFALVELSRAISFWPAAILLCLLFGTLHGLKGDGENILGGAQAVLFGLALAFSFRQTGSLWLGIGYHAVWDYSESFIFGAPDSGLVSVGRLLHPAIQGPDWLSGGLAGPEGSVLTVVPTLGIAAIAWIAGRRRAGLV